jgi:hypothetical protein
MSVRLKELDVRRALEILLSKISLFPDSAFPLNFLY